MMSLDDVSPAAQPASVAVTIEDGLISPGPAPSTYAFTRTDSHRNLFRIPLAL